MKSLGSLVKFFSRSWKGFLFAAGLASLTIFSSIALLGSSSWLIAAAALQPSIAELQVAIVGVRFFGISRGVFRYAERYISHTVTFDLLSRLRVWFYQSIEPAAPAVLGEHHTADLLKRITDDIETLQDFFIRVISPSMVLVIVYIGVSAWFVGFSPLYVLILAVLFLLGGLLFPLGIQWYSTVPVEKLSNAETELMVSVVDTLQGAAEVRVFGIQDQMAVILNNKERRASESRSKMNRIEAVQEGLFTVINGLGWLAVLAVGVRAVESGALEGVVLASLVMASMAAFEAVQPMPLAGRHLREGLQAWKRLTDLLADSPAKTKETAAVEFNSDSKIQFENVSFRYSESEPERLIDINLTIKAGEKIAVVGPNGAGKSSLFNLLLKFYSPTTGRIKLDNSDITEMDGYKFRELFNVIGQHTYIFNASLKDNIHLANPNADEGQILQAVEKAMLGDFIETLPKGLSTWAGEHGRLLSGGERQRVAAARAHLKDAPLQLLDEPLVNLDAVTKEEIKQNLDKLGKGKTVLLISHRLTEPTQYDKIVVMDRGRIIDQGRHSELIERCQQYQAMLNNQSSEIDLS